MDQWVMGEGGGMCGGGGGMGMRGMGVRGWGVGREGREGGRVVYKGTLCLPSPCVSFGASVVG